MLVAFLCLYCGFRSGSLWFYGRYLNIEDRPDITAFNINSGVNFDLDIAMAHPFSKGIVKRASEEKREQEKLLKYQNQITLINRWGSEVCVFGL